MFFLVLDFNGTPLTQTDIETHGNYTGLDADHRTEVILPGAVKTVEVTLMHAADPAEIVALDGAGGVIGTDIMSPTQHQAQTLQITGIGIMKVVIIAPHNEVLLLKFCAIGEGGVTAVEPSSWGQVKSLLQE
jgi:hypothetical protein